jgi:ABC-type lipoprotein export system ATPase subunit
MNQSQITTHRSSQLGISRSFTAARDTNIPEFSGVQLSLSIIGPKGSCKTTLLLCLGAPAKPTTGKSLRVGVRKGVSRQTPRQLCSSLQALF